MTRADAPAEIWISLRTALYAEALDRLDSARTEARRRFAEPALEARSGIYPRVARSSWPDDHLLPLLTSEQAAPLARSFFFKVLREIDAEPLAGDPLSEGNADWRRELEDRHRRLTSQLEDGDIDETSGPVIAILRSAGMRADPASEACNLLHNYTRRAMAQAAAIRLARLDGDFSGRITDSLFGLSQVASLHAEHSISRRKSETTFGHAIGRYLAEVLDLRAVTKKTAIKHRSLLHHIGAFFGRERHLRDIERADCIRFRDTLSRLPPNFAKRQQDRPRSLEQIADENKGAPALAWETQNNYLKMTDDLFAWALKERLVVDNVAADIAPLKRREAAEMQRLPFASEELIAIFAQPVFTGCVDDERRYAVPGPNLIRRSRYWLPLIALFTGMRMGEILHLTTDHVRVSPRGTPFIVLTRDMRLKTESAEREIPLHPALLRLGFLEWVDARRQEGGGDLFDEVPASKHGYRSDTFTKRFATFLKRVSLPEERRSKLCFHSFRHTFKDALNDTGAPESEMDEVCGWSRGKKTGRRYGTGLSADRLRPYVDQVDFGVNLDHLPR